jgi:hypothetical protein
MSQNFCVEIIPTATANVYPKCNYSVMNTRSSNFRPLDFVAQSVRCRLSFVVGDCHRQSLLSVELCLGVHNNKWIVKVLKDDYTLTYWFSVLRVANRT